MLLPSRPSRSSTRHGQIANDSGFGHGMCQNVMIVASGSRSRINLRQQREVVVLHEDDRVLGLGFRRHRVGELVLTAR